MDTEDVRNISRRMNNGNIKTETIRTEKHEVFDDKAAPDDEDSSTRSAVRLTSSILIRRWNKYKKLYNLTLIRSTLSREMIEHDGERYFCAKRDEFTDFFRVDLNNPDSDRKAEFLSHGPHISTEEREILTRRRNDFGNWDEVADDKIKIRKQQIRSIRSFFKYKLRMLEIKICLEQVEQDYSTWTIKSIYFLDPKVLLYLHDFSGSD